MIVHGPSEITCQERETLIRYCRTAGKRFTGFSSQRPCEWNPAQIPHPDLIRWNMTFNDVSAFEYLANLLESPCMVNRTTLRAPPGALAFEILFELPDGRFVYAKLELMKAGVWGRSFHISKY